MKTRTSGNKQRQCQSFYGRQNSVTLLQGDEGRRPHELITSSSRSKFSLHDGISKYQNPNQNPNYSSNLNLNIFSSINLQKARR